MSAQLLRVIQDELGLDLSNADDVRKLGAAVNDLLHEGTCSAFLWGMRDAEIGSSHRVALELKNAAQSVSDAEFFDKASEDT